MRSASSSFRGHPSSVPAARRWLWDVLDDWGLDATGWAAAQVVSELATNCTLHARSEFTLGVQLDRRCLRIEVEDRSPVQLQTRAYGPTSTTGRGLGIVDVLTVEWGVSPSGDGKTVWALLAVVEADVAPGEDVGLRSGAGRGAQRSSAPTGTRAAADRRAAA